LTSELARSAAPYLIALISSRRERIEKMMDARSIDAAIGCLAAPEAGGDHDNALQVAAMAGWMMEGR
jgi:hypothetical protein